MESKFFSKYLEILTDYNRIPKIQIERAVSPILSMFIEEIITESFKHNEILKGRYKLILPEFPLKKDNNQSTNIDYLLINLEKNKLLFVELKTSGNSYDTAQKIIYENIIKKIKVSGADFLVHDINKIAANSSEKGKYEFILEDLDKYQYYLKNIKNADLAYIVPAVLQNKLASDNVICLNELPEKIFTSFPTEWKLLRQFFIDIDQQNKKKIKGTVSKNLDYKEYLKLQIATIKREFRKEPELIWIGITGTGERPNYQIKFVDGTIQPFYSSGKPFIRKKEFNPKKIKGPYEIVRILNGEINIE